MIAVVQFSDASTLVDCSLAHVGADWFQVKQELSRSPVRLERMHSSVTSISVLRRGGKELNSS